VYSEAIVRLARRAGMHETLGAWQFTAHLQPCALEL
jgi:hypothetical protein